MLAELMAARPVTGRRIRKENEQEKSWLFPVEQLQVGDIVRVLPRERIPLDGIVVSGSTKVNRNMFSTGVPLLYSRQVGDRVFCGTINALEPIDLQVEADWQHSGFQQRLEQARAEESAQFFGRRLWSVLTQAFKPRFN